MSETTKISWCDSTLNFWEGCTKVSAGCQHCYAEARDKRFTGGKLWGKGAARRKSKSAVKDALAFNRKPWICDDCGNPTKSSANPESENINGRRGMCDECGCTKAHRRRIFSLSLGDWLDDEVPVEWLAEMLDTIRRCPDVDWILCTKRPELWRNRIEKVDEQCQVRSDTKQMIYDWLWNADHGERGACGAKHLPPPNIILLASVENQAMADLRIPQLLKIPAHRRGLSCEPLLGPVDLDEWLKRYYPAKDATSGNILDWVIIGGESGPNSRPCNLEWIRSIVHQGKAAGVPVFVKQLGGNPCMTSHLSGVAAQKQFELRDKKGGDIAEFPEDLKVREFYK